MPENKTEKKKDLTDLMEYSKKLKPETPEIHEIPEAPGSLSASGTPGDPFEFSAFPDSETLTQFQSIENTDSMRPENELELESPLSITSEQSPQTTPANTMQQIQDFAENIPIGKPILQAAFPFTLMIEGKLSPQEKEKLLDLLSRHEIGIEKEDLEIQFQENRVLIPRISEYAGILLVQALRSSQAILKLVPSDSEILHAPPKDTQTSQYISDAVEHPAENLPLTSQSELPHLNKMMVIDSFSAAATLKTNMLEATRSAEYQEIVEALQKEIKYKAYRKGASGIIGFSIQLTQLSNPSHYRLTAMGTAVKEAPVRLK